MDNSIQTDSAENILPHLKKGNVIEIDKLHGAVEDGILSSETYMCPGKFAKFIVTEWTQGDLVIARESHQINHRKAMVTVLINDLKI